ncbi:MAG: Rrf2 family transcriptional regulator [Alphaproteobacteria bacterium]|nr:Rrf2 family transcriptional regulator [Alphaproteobacteria bacterium]
MILGTKARYAVMAMVELAGRPAGVPVVLADLAESQEITLPYLEQIFARLKNSGLVNSVRGPGGGYVLAQPAEKTYIADIVEAADESLKMTRCDAHTSGCMSTKTRCMTHHLWEGLEIQINRYLSSISLADVRANKGAGDRHKVTDAGADPASSSLTPAN